MYYKTHLSSTKNKTQKK